MSCKILITGAEGFLGSELRKQLGDKEKLVCFSRRDVANDNYHRFEINSYTNYSNTLVGIKCVIHCAARVHIMDDVEAEPLEDYREVNVRGTINLAKQAVENGVKRFIFVSSIKVNGQSTTGKQAFTVQDALLPEDPYGVSKAEAEEQLIALGKETGLEIVIIRPPLVYGEGVKANFASLMNLVSKGVPLPFGCITNNKRSLVSVENLVDLIITCIDHPKAVNQVFLVSDDHYVSTSEMVKEMAIALGKPSWQIPVPAYCYKLVGKLFDKNDVVDRLTGSLQVDISHTKETLGWTPPQTLQEGFKKTAEAFLKSKQSSGK
ncbi:UDP-glucose 4-epimerase family protein [Vibrio vulnificus]|uniref:UDP-glucose 4-epimerase family protein n=1 Tax=Vibrio vulnificus TaxID=672 RepID=UPI001CDC7EFE|nr:SDR family oxidoreductase [Vibrio vulnificus]MCA3950720.1 SDR family oxidoreductase [Vibrio vulnificus]